MYIIVHQLYIYIYPLFLRFFSYIGITEYWVEFPVLCIGRSLLVIYFILLYIYVNPNLPSYPCPAFPSGNHKFVFYICDFYFCFCKWFICIIFLLLLVSTYMWYHMICVFLCLTYLTQYDSLWVHTHFYKWHYLILFMVA